jgi:flagellar biosynthesis chaperone FliJ
MTTPQRIVYPLQDVLLVKYRRVEQAEKVVKEKMELLRLEEEKLKKREEERNKVRNHRIEKLQQLRDTLDHASSSPKIQQMKAYLKVVDEKLILEEKKVVEQKEQVKIAEKNLEAARQELKKKRLEVDKLEQHREEWVMEMKKELDIIDGREMDELGQLIYELNKRKE